MIEREELRPGSAEPSDPAAVDLLLSYVPELAFFDAFEACVPQSASSTPEHAHVDAHFQGEPLSAVTAALDGVAEQAQSTSNGGVAFLVRTMLHFIRAQPVPPSQHPLLVALYLRGAARVAGTPDTAPAIAAAMDRWS